MGRAGGSSHCYASQQVRSLYFDLGKRRKGPHMRGFLRVDQFLVSSNLTQNSEFLPKVSGQYLKNSRLAEIVSGDWFDLRLSDRPASHSNRKVLFGRSRSQYECPLLGAKRTCHFALHMSANDPKRTMVSRRPLEGHC